MAIINTNLSSFIKLWKFFFLKLGQLQKGASGAKVMIQVKKIRIKLNWLKYLVYLCLDEEAFNIVFETEPIEN